MPPLSVAALRRLHALAARYSRVRHEADDIVQDVLLAAVAQGRSVVDPAFMAWATGAIRLRALFLARTAARRTRRESAYAAEAPTARPAPLLRLPKAFVEELPPSRRILALLVNLGMNRNEIAYLLGLTDVALRQRIAGLRRAMASAGVSFLPVAERCGDARRGLARRALKAALPQRPLRQFAVRDPDGLTILISGGHVCPNRGN